MLTVTSVVTAAFLGEAAALAMAALIASDPDWIDAGGGGGGGGGGGAGGGWQSPFAGDGFVGQEAEEADCCCCCCCAGDVPFLLTLA